MNIAGRGTILRVYPDFWVYRGHDIKALPDAFSDYRASLAPDGVEVRFGGSPAIILTPTDDYLVIVPLTCIDYATSEETDDDDAG